MQTPVPELLGNIAQDPLSAVLVGMGVLLFAVSFSVFGYLSLGAALSLLTPN